MTDVQLRFLRAIVERLPLDRIVEAHVFPPMRQGVLESGIAVLVAHPAVEPASPDTVPDEPAPADVVGETLGEDASEADDPTETASLDLPDAAPAEEALPAEPPSLAERARGPVPVRHTVFTARYRLALKGPERGKWELNVVEEADAPLLTVEMVVRGVQQRAGDGAEPERYDVAQLRELLEAPVG